MMQAIAPITDFPTTMINDWIFDLDNTIYPARTNLFLRVAVRITEFVAKHYSVTYEQARVIQKDLFHRYGTTMRGMMIEEAICPDTYLNFVISVLGVIELSIIFLIYHLIRKKFYAKL